MKKTFFFLFLLAGMSVQGKNHVVRVSPQPVRENIAFGMGTCVNPAGETIRITSQGMFWDEKSVVPVMGEIHFSRIPACEWRDELLKMKAGGINIVSTYIFWIHHEEIQGDLNWTGQRNLQAFVSLCKELELKLVLRIGPWCHGEVRNGGLPDWLVQSGMKLRENNPAYLAEVEKWYHAIYKQVAGLLWKDGGPIVGIQIENEYRGKWEHLAQLKSISQKLGFDVPLYTRTGWPALSSPAIFGELIPLYGDYADGFWDRSLREMPGDYAKGYLFRPFRSSTVIATEQLPPQLGIDNPDEAGYPYFTCELGGGMMPSYHRRIAIAPMDVYAMALVRVGSGSNLPGYYMYHGGTNPDGKLSYLNEMQATLMTNYNDLPAKTYDFQAPLGEFGQVNEHYHLLRRL
ncbi:MAG: beta-galactosidase, partial [Dysgonamonadaceae bacterium]|nr:beta-galactosidase [Dysgonamonadaceae bacterium]